MTWDRERETHLREELVRACRVLYRCGIVDMLGHLSAKIDGDHILIKPRPVSWERLRPDDLIVIDGDGQRVDGTSSTLTTVREWPIHTEIYAAREDVGSVLHAHPTHSTLMTSMGIALEPLTRDLLYFADAVPVFDDLEGILFRRAMIETREDGRKLASRLADARAVMLKHHGSVVVGSTIGEVCVVAYYLERAAETMLAAAATATRLPIMHEDLRRAMLAGRNLDPPLSPRIIEERWRLLQENRLADDE